MIDTPEDPPKAKPARRSLASTAAMLLGLAGGYGLFGFIAARFLYPARPLTRRWMFVAPVAALAPGASLLYRTPGGATINVTRQGDTGTSDDFAALSSVCPHLGCQVHWEAANDRYFCPCHNGTFDAQGRGTGGPPGDAGLELSRYPLRVDSGLLFIEVEVESLTVEANGRGEVIECVEGIHGPGHDPCLARGRLGRFSGAPESGRG